jgi:hypothetical protein
MVLSKKSKCVGCKALVTTPEGYSCSLKFPISFAKEGDVLHAPVPQEKCYKPGTTAELKKANELVADKTV